MTQKLEWKKPESKYYIETVCKAYTVSKSMVDGKAKYCAWHLKTALKVTDDAETAKARCWQHKDTGK
jgi:hypothetical protein